MAEYWHVILITFVGFVALAAALLVPVWKFLSREEDAADGFSQQVGVDADGAGPAWLDQLDAPDESAGVDGTSVEDASSRS